MSSGGNWRSRASGGPPSSDGPRGAGWRGGGGGDNWRGGGGGGGAPRPAGERPRLNLKPRGAGGSSQPPTEKLSNLSTLDKEPSSNSRAAAFGAAGAAGGSGMRREVGAIKCKSESWRTSGDE